MKLQYLVVYENSSDKFDIGNCQTKVKVTARLRNFSPFTAIQTIKSDQSTLLLEKGFQKKTNSCVYK